MSSSSTYENLAAKDLLIAIADFGKSRSKVSIVTGTGKLLDSLSTSTQTFVNASNGTIDIEALGNWCEQALATLYLKYRFHKLIPVTHGATAVILQNEKPLPARDYEAHISEKISESYKKIRPDFAETGSPALPIGLNLGRQLFAQEMISPEIFGADAKILTYPQYWVWRWTGLLGTDVSSLGCHTDLWSPLDSSWSTLAAKRGWAQKFPLLVTAGNRAGVLNGQLTNRLGSRVDVHWGVHDSNAALAAFLGSDEPFTLLSTGTWLVAFAVGSDAEAVTLDERRDTLWNVDVTGRPVASARFMAGREREAIAGDAPAASIADIEAILRTDTLALPAFAAGGPFPGHHGKIIGTEPSSASERAALAALYIALMIDTLLDLVGARGSIIVEGPLAADTAALQVLATLRPHQAVKATQSNCVAQGALRLVLGSEQLPAPDTQDFSPQPDLIEPLQAKRTQWLRELENMS